MRFSASVCSQPNTRCGGFFSKMPLKGQRLNLKEREDDTRRNYEAGSINVTQLLVSLFDIFNVIFRLQKWKIFI